METTTTTADVTPSGWVNNDPEVTVLRRHLRTVQEQLQNQETRLTNERERAEKLQAQIVGERQKQATVWDSLSDHLLEAAESHDLCEEFDKEIADWNRKHPQFELKTRNEEHEGSLHIQFSYECPRDEAISESDLEQVAIHAVREHLLNQGAMGADVC